MWRLHAACAVALVGLTLAAYAPVLHGAMQWDDSAHVTPPWLRGLDGLEAIWFRLGSTQQYYPVLHSAFWLEHRLWGDSVEGYHIANVLLHATAACLFARVLMEIVPGGGPAGAWLAAAVFALHPVCVESVAWISEQKNTLSLVFYLLAALAFLAFDRRRSLASYAAASILFILALLSKSVTATLPAALLLVLTWRKGRLARRDVLPLLPWFAAGVAAGLFTAWVERNLIGAHGKAYDLTATGRFLLAGRVVWFYLGKLVWPTNLAFIYPRWTVAVSWGWGAGCAGTAATVALLWAVRRWSSAPLVAFLFFVGSLFPALGFFNVYPFAFSYVADHWQYLPSLGIVALAVEGGWRWASGTGAWRVAAAAAASLLGAFFLMTWSQCALYRDVPTLYADTLAKNPQCWMAHNNLGVYLLAGGSRDQAIAHFREAVRLKPDYPDAHNNLGDALSRDPSCRGAAIREFRLALALEPGMAEAHGNLGRALTEAPGGLDEAILQIRQALRAFPEGPESARAHEDLGIALSRKADGAAAAVAEFETALRLGRDDADIRNSLGVALERLGRPSEAMDQFKRAVEESPANWQAHVNLGNMLASSGRRSDALAEYATALRINPGSRDGHFDLGRALAGMGDDRAAVSEFNEALRLAPESAEVHTSLGSALYRLERYPEALAQYEAAVRLEPGNATFRNNLGLAMRRLGRLAEAVEEYRKALAIDPGLAMAHYNLGVALKLEGRDEEASAEFRASGRPQP